eukprot:311155-Chlamydomonas_euryale.AAC.1
MYFNTRASWELLWCSLLAPGFMCWCVKVSRRSATDAARPAAVAGAAAIWLTCHEPCSMCRWFATTGGGSAAGRAAERHRWEAGERRRSKVSLHGPAGGAVAKDTPPIPWVPHLPPCGARLLAMHLTLRAELRTAVPNVPHGVHIVLHAAVRTTVSAVARGVHFVLHAPVRTAVPDIVRAVHILAI